MPDHLTNFLPLEYWWESCVMLAVVSTCTQLLPGMGQMLSTQPGCPFNFLTSTTKLTSPERAEWGKTYMPILLCFSCVHRLTPKCPQAYS